MNRFILSFLFTISTVLLASGQDFIYDPDKKTKTDTELYKDGLGTNKNLVLIAYKPVMHLPDPAGDMELLINSEKDLDAFHNYVRMGLDMKLCETFKTDYSVISILRNGGEEIKQDLERIYGSVMYNYAERPIELNEKKQALNTKSIKKMLTPKDDRPGKDAEVSIKEGQISSRRIDRSKEYMNVSIKDSTLLPYLCNKYNADVFVFLNQFELKKSFEDGGNIAYAKYGRDVLVHYSVIDKKGKLLYGNVATYNIEEKYDNINEIINISFPHITNEIYGHLPHIQNSDELKKLDKKNQDKAKNQDILRKN